MSNTGRFVVAIALSFFPSLEIAADTLSTYGTPGLVDLPTANVLDDGQLSFTIAASDIAIKNSVTFQFLPNAYGTFRYSRTDDFAFVEPVSLDRSFDVHYQFLQETPSRPAFAIGLRDLVGTGIFSSEYIVATKQLKDSVRITGGIGWGRLAGRNSFVNPLSVLGFSENSRDATTSGLGGQVESGRWFQGEAAIFGGLDWQVNDKWSVQLEYSPDVYRREVELDDRLLSSPLNGAIRYSTDFGVDLRAYVVGGQDFGVQVSLSADLKERLIPGGREAAPAPILPRRSLAAASWNIGGPDALVDRLSASLAEEGMRLDGFEVSQASVSVRITNQRWGVQAQAAGRAARVLANTLPPQIEEFTVVFQERGVPVSSVTTNRADLEELQYDYEADWRTRARADINDASTHGTGAPKLDYSFGPYAATSFFEPQSPIRVDLGTQFEASYQAAPGLTFDARLRYPLVGNLGDSDRESDSVIQKVRSESFLYARESDLEINQLTAEYIWRPAPSTFARVTAGYLEDQYGGISSEVLWSPIDSRFALGAELNYVKQRDFDMLLGFQDYDVVTGHASAYYDLGNGFHSQVDVGRYLAGDWGGTLTVKREFNNGVKVGGYFTLTDVPFDDFGEGSFDKGLTLEIPLSFFTGQPSRRVLSQKIQPILRDGGARLNVQNRLYPLVRDYRGPELSDGWGRYLR